MNASALGWNGRSSRSGSDGGQSRSGSVDSLGSSIVRRLGASSFGPGDSIDEDVSGCTPLGP
eukprot:scaffold10408_cov84-Isochrysis_galbana.AAC.2